MSITITDRTLLSGLAANRGLVELLDSGGELVGRVLTTWPAPRPGPPEMRALVSWAVTDPALLAAFTRVKREALLFDPHGELVGLFERDWYGMPLTPARLREIEDRRRAARKGKGHTLAEVWKIIHEKYVGAEVEPIVVIESLDSQASG